MSRSLTRVCPACDGETDEPRCPSDGNPTLALTSISGTADALRSGEVIGERYRIERPLGRGGMGEVFLATQLGVGRTVALKILRQTSRVRLLRFYREARAASALQHPNVVRVLELGLDEARQMPFIAMEHVDGETLGGWQRRRGHATEQRAAALLLPVVRALEAAHALGIVHRDLKPANLLVQPLADGRERIVVLDFGIARWADDEGDTPLTEQGGRVGTPQYMSPEQAAGATPVAASDLYAVGCILHQLLVGEPPFSGEDPLSVLLCHIHAPPPALPRALPSGAPPSATLRRLHEELLAKSPESRPTDAEVAASLAAIAAGATDEADTGPLTVGRDEDGGTTQGSASFDTSASWGGTTVGLDPASPGPREALTAALPDTPPTVPLPTDLEKRPPSAATHPTFRRRAVAWVTFAATAALVVWWITRAGTPGVTPPSGAPEAKSEDQAELPVPNLMQITFDAMGPRQPALSPDGGVVVFAEGGALYRLQVGQLTPSPLSNSGFGATHPSFSPDGTIVAFGARDGLYVVAPDGQRLERVRMGGADWPSFSPDGRRLMFVDSAREDLRWCDVGGGEEHRVAAGSISEPQWSPDGRWVVARRGGHLWVTSPDGSTSSDISTHLESVASPAWGRDGRFLYGVGVRAADEPPIIWRMPFDVDAGRAAGPARALASGALGQVSALGTARHGGRLVYASGGLGRGDDLWLGLFEDGALR